jgi:hypothetical protein
MTIPRIPSHRPRWAAVLLICLSALQMVPTATGSPSPRVGPRAALASPTRFRAGAGATVRAAERGAPWINLKDGVALEATFQGDDHLAKAATRAKPCSLASADFDEDGVADLVAGYSTEEGGLVALHRGDVDPLFPNTPEAKARRAEGRLDQPFLPSATLAALPSSPDLLAAGDFDADGHCDLVVAERGATRLDVLAGDGRGGFAPAHAIEVDGAVTALAAGEVNRPDGLADVAVGVTTPLGAHLLVFEGPRGALRSEPESSHLPADAAAIVMGQLDDRYEMDIAVAAGLEVVVVGGRDRRLSGASSILPAVEPARVSRKRLSVALRSIAAGDFTGDGRTDLAALGEDGSTTVLKRARASWRAGEISEARLPGAAMLVRADVSSRAADDLVVFDPAAEGLHILTSAVEAGAAKPLASEVTLDAEGGVVAVLPMRLNSDALSDLVVLGSAAGTPSFLLTQPNGTFTVTNTASDNSAGSLQAAVDAANANPGPDAIHFNIPGPGPHTIDRIIAYVLIDGVTVDGTTEPDYAGAPVVVIDGPQGGLGSAFSMQTNCVVRGMSIVNFQGGAGIFMGFFSSPTNGHASGNVVESNYLGLLPSGQSLGNNNSVLIQAAATNNLVGGTVAAARNYISGNVGTGVAIIESAHDNFVRGNYIGTNVAGTAAVANVNGVQVQGSPNNVIGGTAAGSRNVISGNSFLGVNLQGPSVLVQGNYIGTDVTGMLDVGNATLGITMNNAVLNATIGGTTSAARNVVSGNNTTGIGVDGSNNLVQGNYVGVNVAGAAALGNTHHGITVIGRSDGTAHLIGGTAAGAGNVFSGNGLNGVVHGAAPSGILPSVIQGNVIGADATATVAVPNGAEGVLIGLGTLGGTAPGAGNVISGNIGGGIFGSNASGITIQGNRIGTQGDGVSPLGNGSHGISWGGNTSTISIGGTAPGAGNTIAHNNGDGVVIFSFGNNLVTVRGNSIFANTGRGIDVDNNSVSPNDNCDTDTLSTNYPVLATATSNGVTTTVTGTLNSNPSATFSLDFYASGSCDPVGNGEGQTYLGSTMVTTDGSCTAAINVVLPVPVAIGNVITATTTDALGNTGEFSACIQVNDTAPNGRDTVAIYLPSSGAWFERNSNSSGGADIIFGYGPSNLGWMPLRGDWNGDGVDTPGLYDPSSGFFFLRNSNSPGGADLVFSFGPGGQGFVPLTGDWNGDGVDTIGFYVPSNGFFFLKNTNAPGSADLVFGFGPGGSFVPLVGDYNNDDVDTIGIYDPSTGFFFLRNSNAAGGADLVFSFGPGAQGFVPLLGDYDGDGDDTVGIYNPANGFFFLRNTNAPGGADLVFGYGAGGATPLIGDWNGQ